MLSTVVVVVATLSPGQHFYSCSHPGQPHPNGICQYGDVVVLVYPSQGAAIQRAGTASNYPPC